MQGTSDYSWSSALTANTTTLSYWLTWKVLLCAIWVVMSILYASILISRYEGLRDSRQRSAEARKEPVGVLYDEDVWRPCLKGIHPAWLLAFRVVAFVVLLTLLVLTVVFDGRSIFYFYTQWTFVLITIYFGLGSLLSIYGCFQHRCKIGGKWIDEEDLEAEQDTDPSSARLENYKVSSSAKCQGPSEGCCVRKTAGLWGYAFQIIFQMNAGAVMLTDCVFWLVLVPCLEIQHHKLNFWIINMHTVNAVFLLGDTALNHLPFPWFRIAYFFLWTAVYAVFQWTVRMCVSIWWPYPFLDLSSPVAPLWYLGLVLMHPLCFGIFALVMKAKHFLLSKSFPQSYQRSS